MRTENKKLEEEAEEEEDDDMDGFQSDDDLDDDDAEDGDEADSLKLQKLVAQVFHPIQLNLTLTSSILISLLMQR